MLEKLLLPLEEDATNTGGEKYITVSIILPMLNHLKMPLSEKDPGYAVKFKRAFVVGLVNRIGSVYDKLLKCLLN